jgi:uracil phosphoribosyltransferase
MCATVERDAEVARTRVRSTSMSLLVVDHPLVAHRIAILRDETTPSSQFRRTVSEIATLLAYEATRSLHVEPTTVRTPLGIDAPAVRLSAPGPLLVPILRAGLGLLDGFLTVLPEAEVGLVGLRRDEETFEPEQYAQKLPANLRDRDVYILDPMLATGGSLAFTCQLLMDKGAERITAVSVIAAPEGIAKAQETYPHLRIVTAALDPSLNDKRYIVPGLGDAGDRLFGQATHE